MGLAEEADDAPPSSSPVALEREGRPLLRRAGDADSYGSLNGTTELLEQRRISRNGFRPIGKRASLHMAFTVFNKHITRENAVISLALLVLVLSSALNNVFVKTMTNAFANYPYFIGEMPILVYMLVFFPVVWYKILRTNDIHAELRTLRGKRWILCMALFDQLADVLMIYGTNGTRGVLIPLFVQGVVPFTMVFSIVFFGRRYKLPHYTGAVIVLCGVALSALTQHDVDTHNTAIGNILLISSGVPGAIAACVKEMSFRKQNMDLYYLNAWESLLQFFFSILLIPLMSIIPPTTPIEDIPPNLWGGCKCLVGINTLDTDDCRSSWLQVVLFVLFDVIFNVALLIVVKYGSASLMFTANTIGIPLAGVAFSQSWLVTARNRTNLRGWDIGAVCVVLAGLIIYRLREEGQREPGAVEAEQQILIPGPTAVVLRARPRQLIAPRTASDIRKDYMMRLGVI